MGKALYRVRSQTKYLTTITVVKVHTKYLFYEKKSASVSSDLIFTIYYELFSTLLEPSWHFLPQNCPICLIWSKGVSSKPSGGHIVAPIPCFIVSFSKIGKH
jgi:hypothetical protein